MPAENNFGRHFLMTKSVFNPSQQESDISSKITAGLERISEVFKSLLWEKAKKVGLSPIQIQILIFITHHKSELCTISYLAKEFNITKPTVSDAIKVLHQKKMVLKDFSSADSRSYIILLSELGKQVVSDTSDFAEVMRDRISTQNEEDLSKVLKTINQLIFDLNQQGILQVQRNCYACKFHQKRGSHDYCGFLEKDLLQNDIRIDCPEFEIK